jgi:hypothetical protein
MDFSQTVIFHGAGFDLVWPQLTLLSPLARPSLSQALRYLDALWEKMI